MSPPKRGKGGDAAAALRTITSLLTSDVALPAHIPTIVSLLYSSSVLESCNSLAGANGTNAQKRKYVGAGEDVGVLLHKYKTRVSSLLQSKTPQARWSGVALVKASVESSFECLASHGGSWVRLLVPLLVVRNDSCFFCANDPGADIDANSVIYTEARAAFYTQTGDRNPYTHIHYSDYR